MATKSLEHETISKTVVRVDLIESCADTSERRTLDRSGFELLVVGSYLVLMTVAILQSTVARLLWFDEIFTFHLARAPLSLAGHLMAGADQNPPLGYLLTSLCIGLFGESEWVLRLPALAGAWMASLGIYEFVRYRRGPWEAFLAMSVVASSAPVWVYFLEARPYGLAIGFTAMALLAWQRRWPWLFGSTIVLGILSHYYFTVSILAFAVAECYLAAKQRRLDRRFAVGFVASGLMLLAMYPFWGNTSKQYAAHFWSKTKFNAGSVENAYAELARKELAIPFVVALAAGLLLTRRQVPAEQYPGFEAILIAAIVAAPAIGVFLGAKVVGMYHFRYTLPAILGLAAAFALAIGRMSGGHRGALAIASATFVAFGLVGNLRPSVGHYRAEATLFRQTDQFLQQHAQGTILIESPFEFVRLRHYDPNLNIAMIVDLELAQKHTKSDTVDRGLLALAKLTSTPLASPDEIARRIADGERFQYFGPCAGWHHLELQKQSIEFVPVAKRYNGTLYDLRVPNRK